MNKTLIVCVPGLGYNIERWDPLLRLLDSEPQLNGADVLKWEHHCSCFSTKYAATLSESLAAAINGKCENKKREGSGYENIIFLGHSVGAILVRQAYLIGLGSNIRDFKVQQWASKVGRIVLFAGINRGLFPPEDDQAREYPYKVMRWFGRHLIELVSQLPLIHFMTEDLLAGSPFITNLRLWWMRKIKSVSNPPTVVQLVGTDDGIVRSSDSWDIEQDLNGNQIMIDDADHGNIIAVEDKNGKVMSDRFALILKAVLGEFPQTQGPIPQDKQKDLVIFVVHGIRASNSGWVKQACAQIQKAIPGAEVVPATYWYFSALDFLRPIIRRRRVRWFQDNYAYFMARNPKAEFRFLGHSYGTYLLGQSLEQLSGMRFSKVVLAGSVLPRSFNWRSRVNNQQIVELWNHRAQRDVPVAVLCNALRGLMMKDVGTGGYEGFEPYAGIHECCYHPGGHGAALEQAPLHVLTSQIVDATATTSCQSLEELPSTWFDKASKAAHMLPSVILIVLVVVSYLFGVFISSHYHHHYVTMASSMVLSASALLIALAMLLEFL